MGIIRLLKPALFIYEGMRIFIIAVYAAFLGIGQSAFPAVFFAAPAVLFPLMALFLWLDSSRYRAYLPLFAAGKFISVLSLLVMVFVSGSMAAPSGSTIMEMFLLACDFFALAAIFLLIKLEQKTPITEVE